MNLLRAPLCLTLGKEFVKLQGHRFMPSSTLTSKGQTTIPKPVRDHLKLQAGDQIDFLLREDGTVVLRAATVHVRELKGMLHRKNMKAVPVDAMNEAIRRRFRAPR